MTVKTRPDTDGSALICDTTVTGTSATPTNYTTALAHGATYYWYVKASNSSWSAGDTFTPALLSPRTLSPQKDTPTSLTPTYKWQATHASMVTFTVAVKTAPTASGTLMLYLAGQTDTSITPSGAQYTIALSPSTTYYWQVKSIDTGTWSAYETFTTSAGGGAGASALGAAPTQFTICDPFADTASLRTPDGTEWSVTLEDAAAGTVLTASVPDGAEGSFVASADTSEIGDYAAGSSTIVELELTSATGEDLSKDQSIVRTLSINWSKLNEFNPADVAIFWYDPAQNAWREVFSVPGLVVPWPDGSMEYRRDPVAQTISVRVSHFSIYGLFPKAPGLNIGSVATVGDIIVYPNPFVPNDGNNANGRPYDGTDGSGIIFQVPANENIEVKIYNLRGELVDEAQINTATGMASGWDAKNRDGEDVRSGVYFVVFNGNSGRKVVKLMVIR